MLVAYIRLVERTGIEPAFHACKAWCFSDNPAPIASAHPAGLGVIFAPRLLDILRQGYFELPLL